MSKEYTKCPPSFEFFMTQCSILRANRSRNQRILEGACLTIPRKSFYTNLTAVDRLFFISKYIFYFLQFRPDHWKIWKMYLLLNETPHRKRAKIIKEKMLMHLLENLHDDVVEWSTERWMEYFNPSWHNYAKVTTLTITAKKNFFKDWFLFLLQLLLLLLLQQLLLLLS